MWVRSLINSDWDEITKGEVYKVLAASNLSYLIINRCDRRWWVSKSRMEKVKDYIPLNT